MELSVADPVRGAQGELQDWRKALLAVLALHVFTPTDMYVAQLFAYAWVTQSSEVPDALLVSHGQIPIYVTQSLQVVISRQVITVSQSGFNVSYSSDGSHKRGRERADRQCRWWGHQ